MGRINDVIQHRDVIIESLPITHNKSSERWKNVSHFKTYTPLGRPSKPCKPTLPAIA